jgi:pimeloyl-ACP methyl ester carboxylesterase
LADRVFPGEWGAGWRARPPHATWDALDDARHFLQDTHGARIAEIVLGYAGRS